MSEYTFRVGLWIVIVSIATICYLFIFISNYIDNRKEKKERK